MSAAVVVLLGLQLGVEMDTTNNAVLWIPTNASIGVVVITFAVIFSTVPSSSIGLRLCPPQQPAKSVKVGTG